jgi:hypothetical protein
MAYWAHLTPGIKKVSSKLPLNFDCAFEPILNAYQFFYYWIAANIDISRSPLDWAALLLLYQTRPY